jgi:hypothetical protein
MPSNDAAIPYHGDQDMSVDVWHHRISRHKSRIVVKVEGDNYRFIYALSNDANNFEIIPAQSKLAGCFGFTQCMREDKLRSLLRCQQKLQSGDCTEENTV